MLAEILEKVLEDTQCHPNLAISWCTNAKDCLHSIHGLSPYQLTIGKNPKLLSTLNKNVPVLTQQPVSNLSHSIRTSSDIKNIP